MTDPAPILIAGPTASGKSALALALARTAGGVVINADSQQVYAGWRILTARPGPAEEAAVPHRLYGHVPIDRRYSVGAWLDDLRTALTEAREAGRRLVIVGGTGLYFRALTRGLAEIPPVPESVRAGLAARLAGEGRAALADELSARDPETAAGLDLANPRRVLRALEVLEATGHGLARWQAATPPPLLPEGEAVRLVLAPARPTLDARAAARFDAMLANGVLDEARAVAAHALPASAPGLKAVGAPELMAHLAGRTTLDQATTAAKRGTRAYARRQVTWFANQMPDWPRITTIDPDRMLAEAEALLRVGPGLQNAPRAR